MFDYSACLVIPENLTIEWKYLGTWIQNCIEISDNSRISGQYFNICL